MSEVGLSHCVTKHAYTVIVDSAIRLLGLRSEWYKMVTTMDDAQLDLHFIKPSQILNGFQNEKANSVNTHSDKFLLIELRTRLSASGMEPGPL